MLDHPILLFFVSLTVLWISAYSGRSVARTAAGPNDGEREDLVVILTAALTLLGLIIGFTFSMAISRYDQRKDLEAAEANAVGTEMVRVGLMPQAEAAGIRGLLKHYLKQRVSAYATLDEHESRRLRESTATTQSELWSAVRGYASNQPNALAALLISGMNDVLNSQAYTQASWWNRIPTAAWALMAVIAVMCSYMVGYTTHNPERKAKRVFIVPLIVGTSFFLIADIDSPHGGLIRIHPLNLESLYSSVNGVLGEK